MLHTQQKYGVPPRPDAMTPQRNLQASQLRSATTRLYESPAAVKENGEYARKSRERERASPIRAALQDVQLNQYDSVMANSRLEEIRRKYDSQLKRFQEPHTPIRENAGTIKKREESVPISSDIKSHNKSCWQQKEVAKTTESVMGSANKQKESDFLAEQVREIRKSFRAEDERGKSANRSSMFSSEMPSFGRGGPVDDPRVESIDKINMKIKQILNCLNENEKQIGDGPVGQASRYHHHQPAEQMSRDREVSKDLPPKDPRASFIAAQSKAELRISESFISASGQQESRQSFIAKPSVVAEKKDDSRRHSMYAQKPDGRYQRAQSVIPMKSSVMIGKRPETNSSIAKCNGDYILSSGKDLDEQIRKIQQKIKRSEEEKRRLDIKFESRYQQLAEKKKVLPVTVPPKESLEGSNQKNFEAIDIPKLNGQRSSIRKNLGGNDESPSFKQLPTYKEESSNNVGSSSRNGQILRSVQSKDRLTSPLPGHQAGGIASVTKFSLGRENTAARESLASRDSTLRRDASEATVGTSAAATNNQQADAGRYYGYRRPVAEVPRTINVQLKSEPQSPVQTKRLVDHLRQQVAYDEELRNSKLNFAALQDPLKWSKLGQDLNKLGVKLPEGQLKVEFDLSLEQHNPFYSVRETQESTESVARKYTASHDFWSKKICSAFDRSLLERQSFRQDRVDLERKGYLTVEDFVRFLNIQTGTFYRNRDLILIFRRLSADSKVSFDNFMKIVCR